jgi:hypothetical protein
MDIKIINFKSKPKNNFFAPEWNYFIVETFVKNIDFKELSEFLLYKEKDILKLSNTIKDNFVLDGNTGLGENSTTSRYNKYNVFNWENENIKKIKENILKFHEEFLKIFNFNLPGELYIQCWVNIMRNGEKINPHLHGCHPDIYLGGHVCVQVDDTSTFYINPIEQINNFKVYESKNEVGKLTLFQNNIPHYTSVHNSKKERITIAFDLSLVKMNDNYLKII